MGLEYAQLAVPPAPHRGPCPNRPQFPCSVRRVRGLGDGGSLQDPRGVRPPLPRPVHEQHAHPVSAELVGCRLEGRGLCCVGADWDLWQQMGLPARSPHSAWLRAAVRTTQSYPPSAALQAHRGRAAQLRPPRLHHLQVRRKSYKPAFCVWVLLRASVPLGWQLPWRLLSPLADHALTTLCPACNPPTSHPAAVAPSRPTATPAT